MARSQLTISYDHCKVFQGRSKGQWKDDWQTLMEEIDNLSDEIGAKSALYDIQSFMKDLDQFQKMCKNCHRFQNEVQRIEYNRLVTVIKDNLDLIVDVKKQNDQEIPPEVITAKKSLLHCLEILHKSTLMDILSFTKDLDQFEEECTNCCRSENQLEYDRLLLEVRDKLDVIYTLKKDNVIEIPPELINGQKHLNHCLEILHKQGKKWAENVLFFIL